MKSLRPPTHAKSGPLVLTVSFLFHLLYYFLFVLFLYNILTPFQLVHPVHQPPNHTQNPLHVWILLPIP